MYTINHLQLLLGGEFLKFLEKLLFGTYHARFRFLNIVVKHKSFCLLKTESTTTLLLQFWKVLEQPNEILAVESVSV